jgi:hypothetical protein
LSFNESFDDEEVISENENEDRDVQMMKNEIEKDMPDHNSIRQLWKKTLPARRQFIRTHSTKEALEKYPGFHFPSLVSMFHFICCQTDVIYCCFL